MPYDPTNNPPVMFGSGFGGKPFRQFAYKSSDTTVTVAGSGYFSDGKLRGMRVGDVVTVTVLTTLGAWSAHNEGRVTAVSTAGAATVVFATSST
jgi:hypothetical protein